VGAGHQASSHIPFIRSSLKSQIESLNELATRMNGFTGLTDEEKLNLRNRLWDQYGPHNTHLEIVDLEGFIERQFQALTGLGFSYQNKFSTPFMNHAIPIVLLASSLAESLINSMVAVGLVQTERSNLFAVFDRMEIKEKWRIGPSLISNDLHLDLGSHLFAELGELIGLRNAFTHSKLDIASTDGEHKIKGTTHRNLSIDKEGQDTLLRFSELPDKLFDLVLAGTKEHSLRFAFVSARFRFSV
jgi:hypothetical protein